VSGAPVNKGFFEISLSDKTSPEAHRKHYLAPKKLLSDPLDLGIADRVGDLALVGIEPNGAGQGADALGQSDVLLDPI
jgi:hypothetical protein